MDVSQVPRPAGSYENKRAQSWGPPKWVYIAYYVVASYFVATGLFSIITNVAAGRISPLGMLVGGFPIIVGLACILRWDVMRSVIYLFLALQAAGSLLSLLLLSALVRIGPMIPILMAVAGFNLAVTGLMFYLYWKVNEDEF